MLMNSSDGSMGIGKLYRGKPKKVIPRYIEDTLARHHDILCDDLFITHSGTDDELVDIARATVLECLPVKKIHVTRASCTISAHCGPNTLGVLFVTG